MTVAEASEEFVLRFDHNVVEHLGLKLYQNRPANVISELVSNGWDADAHNVWVDLLIDPQSTARNYVSVADDGHGMSRKTIRERFLIIGMPKRPAGRPDMTSPKGRKPMGRKGIGKLAPFGIASTLDVVSIASDVDKAPKLNWLRLELSGIRAVQNNRYEPISIIKDGSLEDLSEVSKHDHEGVVNSFINKIMNNNEEKNNASPSGTLILMRNLTFRSVITPQRINQAMGRRFTVTLLRPDFKVHVNGTTVTEAVAMPKFEQRIPENGFGVEHIDGKEVRFWAGFVAEADWPQDEAGVGVYTHGKIAQDRPFTFGQKGREIISRYMYAVIEADWLDELSDDVVSTDRTSINWEHEQTAPLYEWGNKKVREWLDANLKWRAKTEERDIETRLKDRSEAGEVPKYSSLENDQIIKMVAKIAPSLPRNAEGQAARDELLSAVANAWSNRPMRELLRGLWDQVYTKSNNPAISLHPFIKELHDHSVPEFMSLGVTFAQRAYALSLMYDMINFGREVDLQELLEVFPWIIDPEGTLLIADKSLKSVIDEIAKVTPENRIGRDLRSISHKQEPDFVFLRDAAQKEIVVVEIKHPENALTMENRRQLSDYLDAISIRFSQTQRRGVLIGSQKEGIENPDTRITMFNWTEVFTKARSVYVEMMAAMLKAANPDPADARLWMMAEFGGKRTWELLKRMAEKDEELAELFSKFEKLHARPGAASAVV